VNLLVATAAYRHLRTQCTHRTHRAGFFVLLRRDHTRWRGGVDDGADRGSSPVAHRNSDRT
jgi:hypothetical protein